MHPTATNYMTIEPRILPRGPLDAALGVTIGVLHLGVVAVLASVPTYAVKVLTQNPLAVVLTFLATFFGASIFVSLCTISHLRCDEEGLEFVRAFGKPGKVPWARVESIEEASQAEVVVQGWLWPRFPMREMTATITSLGHYRIRWQGGVAYFAPRDVQRFVYAMQVGRGYAASQQHQSGGGNAR
jgi:hypothetical protein